jgi:hypothetical protein
MVCSDPLPAVPRNRKLWNSFQTILPKRQMLGIPYRGTKIAANYRSSVPNHSVEEKKKLGIPFRGINKEENFRNVVPKHFPEENTVLILFAGTANIRFKSVSQTRHPKISKIVSEKTTFEVRTTHFGMSTFFRGITETVPSEVLGIFLEQNFVPNPHVYPVSANSFS